MYTGLVLSMRGPQSYHIVGLSLPNHPWTLSDIPCLHMLLSVCCLCGYGCNISGVMYILVDIGLSLSLPLPPLSLPLSLYSHEIQDQLRPLLMSFQLNVLPLHLGHEPRPLAVLGWRHDVQLLPPHLHRDLVPSETIRSCQLAARGQRLGVRTKTVKKVYIPTIWL